MRIGAFVLQKVKKYKLILSNAGYLTILEGIKMVLPFLALPYILHVIGSYNYGKIVFIQTVVSYLILTVNYGFNISSVKRIAENQKNREELSRVFCCTIFIKLMIWMLLFLGSIAFFCLFHFQRSDMVLFYACYLMGIGEVFFIQWFFQGIERMHLITIFKTISIFLYIVMLFAFLRTPEQAYFVPLFQAVSHIISAVASIGYLFWRRQVVLVTLPFALIGQYLRESFTFFVARLSGCLYAFLGKFFTGLYLGMHDVAVLDLVLKIISVISIPNTMLGDALYPYNAKNKNPHFVGASYCAFLAFALVECCCLWVMAPLVVPILGDGQLNDAIPYLRWGVLYLFLMCTTTFTGTAVLVAFGYGKYFNRSSIYVSILTAFIYLGFYLTNSFTLFSYILTQIFIELFVAGYRLYYVFHKGAISFTNMKIDRVLFQKLLRRKEEPLV